MKVLTFHSGQGFDYSPEIGEFEVRIQKVKTVVKKFTKLSEAKKYYEGVSDEKVIWDLTSIPELIECHVFEEVKEKEKKTESKSTKGVPKKGLKKS